MNCKQSLLAVRRFYTAEEALTLLTNMSDFEDESTSESKNEGHSSDSSEYTPEQQYQVRTDSNIQTVLPKETVNQNATKHALLADKNATKQPPPHQVRNMLLHLKKYLKPKKYPKRAKKLNLALATFVALKFIQEMHLASHRVMCRKYRMHQKLHALS